MKKIKWTAKNLQVCEFSLRPHINKFTEKEEIHALIKCYAQRAPDDDEKRFSPYIAKKISILCYREEYFNLVVEEEYYSFSGFISFGYGALFLCAERIYTSVGIDLVEFSASVDENSE